MRYSILTGILLLVLTSCTPGGESGNDIPLVSVSIIPQQYFVERIAGERVNVNVMIPPGASPATYAPTVSQLAALEGSSLYLSMGHLGFEQAWMDRIRSLNSRMEVIDLSEGLELIRGEAASHGQDTGHDTRHDHDNGHSHDHGGTDPHTWMSPANVKQMAQKIHAALGLQVPAYRHEFDLNLDAFLMEIDSLDAEIRRRLAGHEGETFMIYHPALAYFARDYGLHQLSLEMEGKEPSPQHMRELTEAGLEHGIGMIFIQREFDRRNAEVLAGELGARVVEINPLHHDWPGQLLYITQQISQTE